MGLVYLPRFTIKMNPWLFVNKRRGWLSSPIGSMGLVYLPTFTAQINHTCRYIYHRPMGGIWVRQRESPKKSVGRVTLVRVFRRQRAVTHGGSWREGQNVGTFQKMFENWPCLVVKHRKCCVVCFVGKNSL